MNNLENIFNRKTFLAVAGAVFLSGCASYQTPKQVPVWVKSSQGKVVETHYEFHKPLSFRGVLDETLTPCLITPTVIYFWR